MDCVNSNTAGAWLSIDLDAICDNWRLLRSLVASGNCAAVVKADAYGLGARPVAAALYRAGCRHFFVAHLGEGMALRSGLAPDAVVYVMHGVPTGAEPDCVAYGLVPVLNSCQQIAAWGELARDRGETLAAVVQVDSGMARLETNAWLLQSGPVATGWPGAMGRRRRPGDS